jgi:signal transduction histidine kinase
MSLRLRFAILFSLSVAAILIISSFIIYFLYYEHRQNEYSTKLRNELKLTFDEFKDKVLKNATIDNSISFECGDNTLIDKEVYIISDKFKVLYAYQNATQYLPNAELYERIKAELDVYYQIGERDFVAEYFEPSKKYVVVSALDNDGFLKLSKLKYYLFFVSLCSLILSSLASYFIASAALKPLFVLNQQIQKTTEQNLSHQLSLNSKNDEVGKIGNNYNALMKRLDKAFDIQKNFIHHASHELRTPLATMYATTEVALQKEQTVEEYKKVLTSLQQEQNNLIELTNSLLFLFQFEKLQFKPNFQSLRLDEVVYESISMSQKNFPSLSINFEFDDIPEEDALIVNGSEVLIKSAFNNLIKNAFLYSTNNAVKIILSTKNKTAKVSFENYGKHLSASIIENIKQPFSSGENIGIKGIGLGLSIVDRIANLHKAKFCYIPKDDGLNIFSITF